MIGYKGRVKSPRVQGKKAKAVVYKSYGGRVKTKKAEWAR